MSGLIFGFYSHQRGRFVEAASNTLSNARGKENSGSTSQTSNLSSQAPTSGLPSEELRLNNDSATDLHAASDAPARVLIPKLQIDAPVTALGLASDGTLLSPGSIYDAGWYSQSATPGGEKDIILNGHANGPSKQGVFIGAKNLKSGDLITIERGDGSRYDYTITNTQAIADSVFDLSKLSKPVAAGKQGLVLCVGGGAFDPTSHHHEQQFVVYASQ